MAVLAVVSANAQLNVTTNFTPQQLVQDILVGQGVQVFNVTYNGATVNTPQDGSGAFANGNSTNLGLDAGVILSSGLATSVVGAAPGIISDLLGTGSDPDLLSLINEVNPSGGSCNDKAVLEFDFIPQGDSLKFNFVFGSEEYPSFNCSPSFNDVFGFFLSGPGITGPYTGGAANIALVPGTNLAVSIANIHGPGGSCGPSNAEYYVDNSSGTQISLNGFTVVLQARAAVVCGEVYHIKLGIADAGDSSYNSAVFLQAGSFQSNILPPVSTSAVLSGDATIAEGCEGSYYTIYRPAGALPEDSVVIDFFMSGTATAGVDYDIMGSPVILLPGQDSLRLYLNAIDDGVDEGPESAILNVYGLNACGDTIVNSAIFAIIDYKPLIAHTDMNVRLNCDQEEVQLYAYPDGGFGQTVLAWGDTLYQHVVSVPGLVNGTYALTVSDQCPKSRTFYIEVDAGCEVVIPNVMTPNGDSSNDRFVVEGLMGRENSVVIWNRWGKEVFSANNYQNNFSPRSLNDGIYFYLIRVLDKEYTGSIHVLSENRR